MRKTAEFDDEDSIGPSSKGERGDQKSTNHRRHLAKDTVETMTVVNDNRGTMGETLDENQRKIEAELAMKEDTIARLMAELQSRNQLVMELQRNQERSKQREDKREKSSQAINATLQSLESKLKKFT